jgi:hypothetical protein
MRAEPKVRTMYLSADGVLPLGYLQGFSPKCVRVAMNQDSLGQQLTQEAKEGLPHVKQMQPEQKDWIGSLPTGRARAVRQGLRRQAKDAHVELGASHLFS